MWPKLRSSAGFGPVPSSSATLEALSDSGILAQEVFLKMIRLERKRTERSQRPFVLMLLESPSLLQPGSKQEAIEEVLYALSESTRETDITGWYKDGSAIGVIFTEIRGAEGGSITNILWNKVSNALCSTLTVEQIHRVKISFHMFPEKWNDEGTNGRPDSILYPDLMQKQDQRKASHLIKRCFDVTCSLVALTVLSPALLLIAVAVKLTSKGPVLFRQKRLGQYGKEFIFVKFRSMYFANDQRIHEEYVTRFIAGTDTPSRAKRGPQQIHKLTDDPRVTPVGRFLRKTSLDELPQFLNVLGGEMSLVGPRPPIPYEYEHYDLWHRRRLSQVKPGITGLWQVEGRSKLRFDEMVRLDLKYADSWSLWLDLKILLRTPKAVLSGEGAY